MVTLLFTAITHPCLKWHVDLRPQAIETVVEMLAELLKSASNYKTGQNIDLTFGRNGSIQIKVC